MKKTLSVLLILATVLACLCLCGCAKYPSSYNAILFVHSNTNNTASMTYSRFEGTFTFKLKTDKEADNALYYAGQTEDAGVTVYYDCGEEKQELFVLAAGESASGSVALPRNATVYVIVTTDGKASNGSFSFDIR